MFLTKITAASRGPAALLTLCLCSFSFIEASDHLDAPALQIGGVGQLDVNDLYAFQSPNNPNNSVLVLTVNPFAGVVSGTDFGTDVEYEFLIDNNSDALVDITYNATFSANGSGQDLLLTRNGATIAAGLASAGSTLAVSTGGMVTAGLFDDPFFFDLVGFNDNLNFTGDDTLAGANVSAIVLEIPSSDLGTNIGVWVRTTMNGSQIDRAGRPAINTVLIPSARKDEFNAATPDNDAADFGADVEAAITGLSGDAAYAVTITGVLLPDVLTFDTSDSSGFLNGRMLADDVIDAELDILTMGALTTGDGVDFNDVPFRDAFPYLAAAHVPEPSSALLFVLATSIIATAGRRR